MPKERVEWGIDPSIADPSSPNYNEADPDFAIAELMLARGREMSGLASQNVDVTEGASIQIWDIPKGVICFLNCAEDLDEITISTQSAINVSDAQQLAIYSTNNIGVVNWTGITIDNAPTALSAGDYYSFRYRQAGTHYIRTVSP